MDAELIDAFERFRRAVEVHQADHDRETPHGELTRSANDIVRMRLELYRCLVRQGWNPPDGVGEQMAADQLLIGEEDDSRR